jgi:hypothetical protein
MKCGNRKFGNHEHGTVAEVRACYGIGQNDTPTEMQAKVMQGVLPPIHEAPNYDIGTRDRHQAPKVMEQGHTHQLEPRSQDEVPEGHYATKSRTGRNDYDFWVVVLGKGKWQGRKFVNRIVGGKPDWTGPRVSRNEADAAFRAILTEGVDVTGKRYGVEIGRCRYCNRALTEYASRTMGEGPDCADEHGHGDAWQELNRQFKSGEIEVA